eukprot:7328735-Prorocentrum_lima.AAC.1
MEPGVKTELHTKTEQRAKKEQNVEVGPPPGYAFGNASSNIAAICYKKRACQTVFKLGGGFSTKA